MSNDETLFSEDFSDATAAAGGVAPTRSGPYKVKLVNPEVTTSSAGNPRIRYTLEIVEDPSGRGQEGCTIFDGQNVPSGKNAHISKNFWLLTLVSLGHNEKKLKRKFDLKKSMIDGKTGYIFFKTKQDNDGKYTDVSWLKKEQYRALAKNAKAMAEAESEADDSDDDGVDLDSFELPETPAIEQPVADELMDL